MWQSRSNPDNFDVLLHGGGLVALIVAAILIVLGSAWARSVVNSVVS